MSLNLCELLANDQASGKLGSGWLELGNWDWEGFHPLATAVTSERKFAMISNDDNTHGSQIQTFIPIEREPDEAPFSSPISVSCP